VFERLALLSPKGGNRPRLLDWKDHPMFKARLVVTTTEITPTALEPVHNTDPDVPRLRDSIEPKPLDWDVAVCGARVLLSETFGPPGPMDNPILAGMAQELAALLCAYGQIGDAVHQR
jgi:hypothetical protein